MVEQLLAFCLENRLLQEGDRVTVALSGGADSMALLSALLSVQEQLDISIHAAHFNHQLRGAAADEDEAFVIRQCKALGVSLRVGRGDVRGYAEKNDMSLEQAARTLRYAFLQSVCNGGKIATAHTADDNAETLLLHLLRGSGLRGLCGIAPMRGNLIRPLLTVTREQLDAYLSANGISHVEDATNAQDDCTRNRLRHHVMPQLLKENPSFLQSAARTAQLLRQDDAYLSELTEKATRDCTASGGYSCKRLRALPAALRSRVLVGLLWQQGLKNPSAVCAKALDTLVFSEKPSAKLPLQSGLFAARRYDTLLFCTDAPANIFPETALNIPGCTDIPQIGMKIVCSVINCSKNRQKKSNTLFVRYDMITETFWYLRSRRSSDTLTLSGGTKRINRLMIDRKIPLCERDALAVLVCGERVAAVYGIGTDVDFLPRDGQTMLEICFEKERNDDKS